MKDNFKKNVPISNSSEREVKKIHISELKSAEIRPFKVKMDETLIELAESIRLNGVLEAITVRKHKKGGYEILSGYRRVEACKLAKVIKIPAIIKELDDDNAIILMVDSNLHREKILPSEKGYAYKLKLDALKRQGKRSDLTSSQIGTKLRADEVLAKSVGESRNQVQRYIRLTNLIDKLLNMVDNDVIPLNAAVELSYLGSKAQADIADIIEKDEIKVSINQATKIKQISKDGKISYDVLELILTEEKPEKFNITLKEKKLKKYFPENYSKKQIENIVFQLLELWYKSQKK